MYYYVIINDAGEFLHPDPENISKWYWDDSMPYLFGDLSVARYIARKYNCTVTKIRIEFVEGE